MTNPRSIPAHQFCTITVYVTEKSLSKNALKIKHNL